MQGEKINPVEGAGASVATDTGTHESVGVKGWYDVVCLDANGNVKWTDTIKNVVVTVGKNDLLDKYLQNGVAAPAWYMGLIDATSYSAPAATDTLAAHPTWLEIVTGYSWSGSATNRATVAWNAASGGSKQSTTTVFNITAASLTVQGALLTVTQARGTASNGGAGVLLSAGPFGAGSRAVVNGDTLNVTYTLSV